MLQESKSGRVHWSINEAIPDGWIVKRAGRLADLNPWLIFYPDR